MEDEELRIALEVSKNEAAHLREDEEELQMAQALSMSTSYSSLSLPNPRNLSRSTSEASKWPCDKCTYKNAVDRISCYMCGYSPTGYSPRLNSIKEMVGCAEFEEALRAQMMVDNAITESEQAYLSIMSDAEYEEALRAQLMAEEFTNEWVMDNHSADVFSEIWRDDFGGGEDYILPPPPSNELIQRIAETAHRLALSQPEAAPVDLGNLARSSQNVHNSAVEQVAFQSIAQLVAQPLPAGVTIEQMVEFAKEAIGRVPAGLQPRTAQAACAELSNPHILTMRHNNQVYKNGTYEASPCDSSLYYRIFPH